MFGTAVLCWVKNTSVFEREKNVTHTNMLIVSYTKNLSSFEDFFLYLFSYFRIHIRIYIFFYLFSCYLCIQMRVGTFGDVSEYLHFLLATRFSYLRCRTIRMLGKFGRGDKENGFSDAGNSRFIFTGSIRFVSCSSESSILKTLKC